MKCNNCGYDNEKGNAFCIKCGNKLEDQYESMYAAAVKQMESAVSSDDYYYVKSLFNNIAEYKDSSEKMTECENKAKELQAEEIYVNANKQMHSATTRKEFLEAKGLFSSISQYKDSAEKATKCDEEAEKANQAHMEEVYINSLEVKSSDNPNEIKNAIEKLKSLHGYKNSDQLITEYENKLITLKEQQKSKEEKREATGQKQNIMRVIIVILSLLTACIVIGKGAKLVIDKSISVPQEMAESYTSSESITFITETSTNEDTNEIESKIEDLYKNTEPAVTDPYVIAEKEETADDEYIKNNFSYSIEDDHVTIYMI